MTSHHLRPIIVQRIEDETSALQSNNNGIEVSQDGWDNHDANGNEIEWEKKG
jgi:hypothetical protein